MKFSINEILSIFQVEDEKEVNDSYEVLIFEVKQKFLSIIPPIQLIRSNINRLIRLNNAYFSIHDLKINKKSYRFKIDSNQNLGEYLKEYQIKLNEIKLIISSVDNGVELISILETLIDFENQFYKKCSCYYDKLFLSELDKVKFSEIINVFEVQQELNSIGHSDSEIMNYLRKQIKKSENQYESPSLKLVLKAYKIIDNG